MGCLDYLGVQSYPEKLRSTVQKSLKSNFEQHLATQVVDDGEQQKQ